MDAHTQRRVSDNYLMEDLKQTIINYSSKDLEQKKRWYSPAAEAYNKARPHYPQALIQRVVEVAQLSPRAKILEVGCGPATATLSFAPLDYSMICLEPNPDFFKLAQHNCQSYPNVNIQNIAFEEWTLEAETFDAVLAASSFHWIPPEVGYPKAAAALKDNGYLVLLWNKQLQPSYEVYQRLLEVYAAHAPGLALYEDRTTQEEILNTLGQFAIASGQFKNLVSESLMCDVTYSADDYLMLLSTYSPYLQLELQSRNALFADLRELIEHDCGGTIQLSYLSAFHITQKLTCP